MPNFSKTKSIPNKLIVFITFENLAFLSLLALSVSVLLTNYMGLSYSEIISFDVIDGWCDPPTQGIGNHCFGDFYAPTTISQNSNPWDNFLHLAYTPLSFSYFNLIASQFVIDFGLKLPIYLNLGLTIAALTYPGIHQMRLEKTSDKSSKWILAVLLTSTPSLMLIDRGSNNYLLVPLLYFYLLKILANDSRSAAVLLVAMSLWKPQMILFGMLFLIHFGVKKFAIPVISTGICLVLSFAIYPKGYWNNISNWLMNSQLYQTYAPSPALGNYSFSSFLGYVEAVFNGLIGDKSESSLFENPFTRTEVSTISLAYGLLAFSCLYLARTFVSKNYQFLAVTVFFIQMTGTTFGYYLIFLLIPLIFIVKDREFYHRLTSFQSWNYAIYGVLMFILVPAWPFSMEITGGFPSRLAGDFALHLLASHILLSILSTLLVIDFLRIAILQRNSEIKISSTNI